MLNSLGIQFGNNLVEFEGRILPMETMQFADGDQLVDDNGDFNLECKSPNPIR